MDWSYYFKHWFATLLLGPIILTLMHADGFDIYQIFDFLEFYMVFLICSLIFSTPTYILYSFIYSFLGKKNTKVIYAKVVLITFAVAGVNVSFWLIGGRMIAEWALSYSIASIITGLIFKLEFKESTENQE